MTRRERPRVTEDTPDPHWFVDIFRATERYHRDLVGAPMVCAVQSGRIDPVTARQFLLQFGLSVIQPFPERLAKLLRRPGLQEDLQLFLRANRIQERAHWRGWLQMSQVWDIDAVDFAEVTLCPKAMVFREYFDALTDTRTPLAVALLGILSVESAAAKVTTFIAPALSARIGKENTAWIEAHAEIDTNHLADLREFTKRAAREV